MNFKLRYRIYNIHDVHCHVVDTMHFNEANFFWNLADCYKIYILSEDTDKMIQFVGTPIYQTLPKA